MRQTKSTRRWLAIAVAVLALPYRAFAETVALRPDVAALDLPDLSATPSLGGPDLGGVFTAVSNRVKAERARSESERKKGPYPAHRWLPMDKQLMYLVDGDTVYYGEKGSKNQLKIRVLGIDTPEVAHFGAGKFVGQPFGKEATAYARKLVREAEKVKYLTVGLDKYGRTLAHILLDDRLLSTEMIEKGLAYETVTTYGNNGLPDIAADILAADKAFGERREDFELPHDFRHREWTEEKEAAELRKDERRKRAEMDKEKVEVDDGDTVLYKGKTFRLAGADTPEIIHKEEGILVDQPYGRTAATKTRWLIENAKKVEFIEGEKDKYGRTLAHIFIDGKLLSALLIQERLAYEIVTNFGPGDFPGFSRQILRAARSVEKPPFENPIYWRGKHQHHPNQN